MELEHQGDFAPGGWQFDLRGSLWIGVCVLGTDPRCRKVSLTLSLSLVR
jgi:hypothetical protein